MIITTKGEAPYYLDCAPADGLFERAPGALSLVCDENESPARFEDPEEAEQFLLANVDATERSAYRWTLVSAAEVQDDGSSDQS